MSEERITSRVRDRVEHFKKHGVPFIKDKIYKNSINPLIRAGVFGEPLAIADIETIDSDDIEVIPYGEENTLSLDSASDASTGGSSSGAMEYHFERSKVATMSNTKLRGSLGYTSIETLEQTVIFETGTDRLDLLYRSIGAWAEEVLTSRGHSSKRQFDTAAPFIGPMTNTYFHWISDYLLRVRGLFKYDELHGTLPTLLIPADSPQWVTDSLRMVGYPEDMIAEWSGGVAEVNKLVVPSSERHHHPWDTDEKSFVPYNPAAFRWLSEKMKEDIDLNEGSEWPSNLLISRRDSHTRRILNLESLANNFEPDDIEILELSNISLEEQMRYFHHADVVIAAHGAGLTNIIFGDQLRVVETHGDLYTPLYHGIASGLGHSYSAVKAKQQGDDLIIDEKDILRAI